MLWVSNQASNRDCQEACAHQMNMEEAQTNTTKIRKRKQKVNKIPQSVKANEHGRTKSLKPRVPRTKLKTKMAPFKRSSQRK